MNISRWKHEVRILKTRINTKGVSNMGVSMGLILPMSGQVAKDFIEQSKKASISKETLEKCRELSKCITKR